MVLHCRKCWNGSPISAEPSSVATSNARRSASPSSCSSRLQSSHCLPSRCSPWRQSSQAPWVHLPRTRVDATAQPSVLLEYEVLLTHRYLGVPSPFAVSCNERGQATAEYGVVILIAV